MRDFVFTFATARTHQLHKKAGSKTSDMAHKKRLAVLAAYPAAPRSTRTEAMMYLGATAAAGSRRPDKQADHRAQGLLPDEPIKRTFIQSVRTRGKKPTASASGSLSACLVHLGNISFRWAQAVAVYARPSVSPTATKPTGSDQAIPRQIRHSEKV